ncbi:hypothetical protein PN437_20070 [Microcystis aeruginosa CS-564/01]|uniref:hypothetical protein n=1 Tax=Microcystis aeruginosa TaxID=1126 RepID=UPI00232AEF6F|nr:hypothetical protein [Microcystis aeruginosa]MDB9427162.1 hypothetical protein [Microcystis aeruginosa CS-564/01]
MIFIQGNSSQSYNPNSVLIPLISLKDYGLKEFDWEDTPKNRQKAILAVLKLICATPFVKVLGLEKPAKPSQTTPYPNIINTTYALTHILQGDLLKNTLSDFALPPNGIGGLRLEEIFGKAAGKNNNLIVPFDDIYREGYQISEDNRSFFSAFFRYLVYSESIPVRNSSNPSAIIKKSASNPSVDALSDRKVAIKITYSITFQQVITQSDTLDLNFIN